MNDTTDPLDTFLDGVEREVEEAMRPRWERRWKRWWTSWKDATPKAPRDVMEWALAHHSEGDPFDREAEEAATEVAPDRGDWDALRNWQETVCENAGDALEAGALDTWPTDLPAPPFVPTEEELDALTDGVEKTPEGTARALLAHVGHVARFHHRFLQSHD